MSVSSRNSSKKKAIDAPFDPEIEKRAYEIVDEYRFVIEREEGHYYGHAVEMPYCFGDGATPDECLRSAREGAIAGVAYMLEQGEPAPASKNKRTEQLNLRLTAMEKMQLEEAARREGFRGVSDFVRRASLEQATKTQPPATPSPKRTRSKNKNKAR